MKTILYLGNTYCSNITELKSIIERSPAQDSLLGKELLCALKDGTLSRWLNEGNDEEQSLVDMLPTIQAGSSDSDLLKKLGECFNSDYKTQKFNITDFIVILFYYKCNIFNYYFCIPYASASALYSASLIATTEP